MICALRHRDADRKFGRIAAAGDHLRGGGAVTTAPLHAQRYFWRT
jgi:hypothetical protein